MSAREKAGSASSALASRYESWESCEAGWPDATGEWSVTWSCVFVFWMGGRGGAAPLPGLAEVADCAPAEDMGDKPGNMLPTGKSCNCGGCCGRLDGGAF